MSPPNRTFAVIQTVDSFGELEVSVVSQRWLSANGSCCLYPRMRNAATKVIAHAKPDRETWQNIACTVLQSNIESHTEAQDECERREKTINNVTFEEDMSDEDDVIQLSPMDETTDNNNVTAESHTADEAETELLRVEILNVASIEDIVDPDYEPEEDDFLDLAIIDEAQIKTEDECGENTNDDFNTEHISDLNGEPRHADVDEELPIVDGTRNTHKKAATSPANRSELASLKCMMTKMMRKINKLTALVEAQTAQLNSERRISRDSNIKLPDLPLTEVAQVERLDRQLRDDSFKRQMVLRMNHYLRPGSTNVQVCSLMRKLVPDHLAVFYSWSGMSCLNGAKSKHAFSDKLGILRLISATISYVSKEEMLPKELTRSVQEYFKRTTTRQLRNKQS